MDLEGSAKFTQEDHQQINQLFLEYDHPESPGVAVVIIRDNQVIYDKAFGMANLEYGIPVNNHTVFHIGSVSKQFTAFSILLLEHEGLLSLDDNIGKYLYDLPKFMQEIKVSQLIFHTNGLREIETLNQIAGITTADQISSDYLYELIKNQKELNLRPGEELEYNNAGYFLLAKIVESITKITFKDWTSQNIFAPLKMAETLFYDDCQMIIKNRAYPYLSDEGQMYKGILNYSFVGPTSLMTTSLDMAKWTMNLFDPTLGDKELMQKYLQSTGILNSGESTDYGFGLGITNYKNLKVCLHSGHDAGYRSAVQYYPDEKTGIVILGNFYNIDPADLCFKIADILFEEKLFSPVIESHNTLKNIVVEPQSITLEANKLEEFCGDYFCSELGVIYEISQNDNGLTAQYWRNDPIFLTPVSDDLFSGNKSWFKTVRFERDASARIINLNLNAGRVRNLNFKKIN